MTSIEEAATEIERWIAAVAQDSSLAGTASHECRKLLAKLGQGWIPVSERLPDSLHMVLMACPVSQRGAVQYGYYDGHKREFMTGTALGWEPVRYTGDPVTHWMPLPPPPERP